MGKLYSITFEFGCKIQSTDQHDDDLSDSLDVSFEEQKNMKNINSYIRRRTTI
jgi:hypothetical protein